VSEIAVRAMKMPCTAVSWNGTAGWRFGVTIGFQMSGLEQIHGSVATIMSYRLLHRCYTRGGS
jgi:hypothetical protein